MQDDSPPTDGWSRLRPATDAAGRGAIEEQDAFGRNWMMTRRTRLRSAASLLVVAGCLLRAAVASAQGTEAIDKAIHDRWAAILGDAARQHGVTIAKLATMPVEARRLMYREALLRLSDDPELQQLAARDSSLIEKATPAQERGYLDDLKEVGAEHTQVKSLNATSTNPAAGSVAEHSGFSELLALALNGQTFFNADATALSVNLSALALYSLGNPRVYSNLRQYQQHSFWRRLGGTVVFGAKIPEKQITGISGLPDADKLLDVFTWDVKIRVLGDKDPIARRWFSEAFADGLLSRASVVQADVPAADAKLVTEELTALIRRRVALLKTAINQSPQLTFKTSGTHLTKETGKNKYTAGLLFDQGFGAATDVTADLLYSVADDVRLGADNPFQVKQLILNAAVMTKLAPDVIVNGRTIDWSNGASLTWFTNKSALPIDVLNTWKIFTKLEIPVTDAASIPLSIVYTNDKNELQKTNYVSGFIGVSYDFWAAAKPFKYQQ